MMIDAKTLNALHALQDSLLDSIKLYYNMHLRGGINDYNYYLSVIIFEHLSVQDRILHKYKHY